jgi:hypothetical protein
MKKWYEYDKENKLIETDQIILVLAGKGCVKL